MRTTMIEIHESYLNWSVLCVFLLAIASVLGAAAFVFTGSAAGLQTGAQIVGWLALVAFFVTGTTVLLRQTRLLLSLSGPADLTQRGRFREDGYIFNAIKTASWFSCAFTATTLYVLDLIVEDTVLPAGFFIKLVLFVCLATFSIVYFVLNLGLVGQTAGRESA